MNADSKPFFTLRRTEDGDLAIKTSVLGIVSGVLFVIGAVGGSGYFRDGKYTDDMATADNAELEARLSKEFRVLLEDYLLKEEYREKHADMRSRVLTIQGHDEQMILDIRNIYSLLSKLPPQELENAVSQNTLRLDHLDKEHGWIMEKLKMTHEHRNDQ